VSIVEEILAIVIIGKGFPRLLECPIGDWIFGAVEVKDSSRPDLHRDEYIEDAEPRCHGNEEVTGYDGVAWLWMKVDQRWSLDPGGQGRSSRIYQPFAVTRGSGA